jgi:hypothetical protein
MNPSITLGEQLQEIDVERTTLISARTKRNIILSAFAQKYAIKGSKEGNIQNAPAFECQTLSVSF